MTRTDNTEVPDYPARLRLDGRGFVVIGAGQGIGRQVSHALASVGAKVFGIDMDPDLAADIAEETGGFAGSGDATVRADAERLFAEAQEQLGRIDGLVDIVGITRYGSIVDMDDESWNFHHDLNLRHAFLAMQLGARAMRDHGGAMVFIASVSGIAGAPLHAAYGAAKAGVISLVRSGAVELGPLGIRVNAVAPGVVWTPRVSEQLGAEARAQAGAPIPLGRTALPSDIASAVLFLASDLGGYINGQTLVVDGGISSKFPYPMPDSLAKQAS